MFFLINKMFLHCFSQRYVSPLAMSHLQVDQFFCKANHTNRIANCMVCLAKKKISTWRWLIGRVETIQLAMLIVWFVLQRKNWSTWRWPIATVETCRWEKQCKNILLIKNIKWVVFDCFAYTFYDSINTKVLSHLKVINNVDNFFTASL